MPKNSIIQEKKGEVDKPIERNKVSDINERGDIYPKKDDKGQNPLTGGAEKTYSVESLTRLLQSLNESYHRMEVSVAHILTVKTSSGTSFTIHPASCFEVYLKNPLTNHTVLNPLIVSRYS